MEPHELCLQELCGVAQFWRFKAFHNPVSHTTEEVDSLLAFATAGQKASQWNGSAHFEHSGALGSRNINRVSKSGFGLRRLSRMEQQELASFALQLGITPGFGR